MILFLHLLGSDVNGHSHKPHSSQYQDNVNVVDHIARKVANLVEARFDHDGATAFVMTADHGMTDWGSHGAGSEHETLTPFVVWGSGINGRKQRERAGDECDKFDNLQPFERINQIDIASFISALISIPTPSNSLGSLPWRFINSTENNIRDMLHGEPKIYLT